MSAQSLAELAIHTHTDASAPRASRASSSIPQKNRKIQEGAINSLALYASLAHALVIVAPSGRHSSNDSIVSKESYQVRGIIAVARRLLLSKVD